MMIRSISIRPGFAVAYGAKYDAGYFDAIINLHVPEKWEGFYE